MTNSNQFSSNQRIDWIDYAKGIGIFLVVLGHTLRGLLDSPGLGYSNELQAIDTWIYAFHMPLFFFLSGLLAKRSNGKSIKHFLAEKLGAILYPYAVWSLFIGDLRVLVGQNKVSLSNFMLDFWKIVYQPIDIFWFLYALFLISTIYFFLSKLKLSPKLILIGSAILYIIHTTFPELSSWEPLAKIEIYSIYFTLGTIVSAHLLHPDRDEDSQDALFFVSALIGFTVIASAISLHGLTSKEPNPLFGFMGVISCILLSKPLCKFQWSHFIKDWGNLSLQIYVAHTAAASMLRITLQKIFRVDNLLVHAVLEVMAGIYLPILLYWFAEKIRFQYLFTLPRRILKED